MLIKTLKQSEPAYLNAFFLIAAIILVLTARSFSATVIMTNGATIEGRLVKSTDKEIRIQDPGTGQVRSFKNVLIREIYLEPDEQKMLDMKEQKIAVKIKGAALEEAEPAARSLRHFMFALAGGACKILNGPGPNLNFGYGGNFIFQYNYIFKGLGLDLHASFYYNADKKYPGSYITILPVMVSPLYRFNTKYIDIDLRAGAGISYTGSKSGMRLKLVPSSDPAQGISTMLIKGSNGQSIDLALGAGAGISHTFDTGVSLGFEVNYYFIFQTLSAHALSASIYCGYAF